eukprot:1134529-Pleurochrysis_carterae.AAC.1
MQVSGTATEKQTCRQTASSSSFTCRLPPGRHCLVHVSATSGRTVQINTNSRSFPPRRLGNKGASRPATPSLRVPLWRATR